LYILCQALDLRALQREFLLGLDSIIKEESASAFGSFLTSKDLMTLQRDITTTFEDHLDKTTFMDNVDRMASMAASSSSILVRYFTGSDLPLSFNFPSTVSSFQSSVAGRSSLLMDELQKEYTSGTRGPTPASQYLGKTKPVYEFIRKNLGVRMHGYENYTKFANGLGVDDATVGQNISRIFESIRDGKIQTTIVPLFD